MPGRARLQGEHYTWRNLWYGALGLQERGRSDDDGNWWLTLSALLLCFSALEAYLNYIGPLLCPAEWEDEKAFFSKGRYRGTLGKLAFLMAHCGLAVERDRRPWQTLKELNKRRDKLLHPRSQEWDQEVSFEHVNELGRVDAEFYALADENFVDKALADMEAVCDPLHQAASKKLRGPAFTGRHAFQGLTGHQGGSIVD